MLKRCFLLLIPHRRHRQLVLRLLLPAVILLLILLWTTDQLSLPSTVGEEARVDYGQPVSHVDVAEDRAALGKQGHEVVRHDQEVDRQDQVAVRHDHEVVRHEENIREAMSANSQRPLEAEEKKRAEENDNVIAPPQNPEGPGEMGRPVRVENPDPETKKKLDEGWQKNAFNQHVSDMISVHRSLPDFRDPWCKAKDRHLPVASLPSTSVIICFHNEAWSVLLRTVHSVLARSPPPLLEEVILVDDASTMEHVKADLDRYMAQYPKVRIVRAAARIGLIRARLMGASHARGQVLTYLDSHCEATDGWLEPLLDRIARNSTIVVCPVIDIISDDTLQYQKSGYTAVGGFDWNLQFNWHAVPAREKSRHAHPAEPVWSPTMAGGLFAIDRAFFERLGTYDSGFDIWGGENLELSFKTWMCGGTLEIVPCSHVGHIFRKRSPYKWRSGVNVLRRNSIRLAEVWLDDYKRYYYDRIGPDLGDFGDISSRKKLRQELGCRSFDWYVKNVYPELFIPGDAVASGEIRNMAGPANKVCLDSPAKRKDFNKPVGLYHCHKQGGNQYWMLSKNGEIRRDDACLDFNKDDVMLYGCHGSRGNQEWRWEPVADTAADEANGEGATGQLRHGPTGQCLGVSVARDKLVMAPCRPTALEQIWRFSSFNKTAAAAAKFH